MITRIVKMTFLSGEVKKFLEIFNESSELIGTFDGCHGVKLMQDADNDDIYFTLSEWQSEKHLNIYRSSSLFKNTWAKVKPLFSEKAEAWSLVDTISK